MKMKALGWLLFIAVLVIWGFSAYLKDHNPSGGRSSGQIEAEIGQPIDYLPIETGRTFSYKIEVGDVQPLQYRVVVWPEGSHGTVQSSRSLFVAAMAHTNKPQQKTFSLRLRVKGPAVKQGPLSAPIGVELAVDKDDLGIYRDVKKVFWTGGDHDGFVAHELITFDANSFDAPSRGGGWGGWGSYRTEDGYSLRISFFGEKPGVVMAMGEEPKDHLLFKALKRLQG